MGPNDAHTAAPATPAGDRISRFLLEQFRYVHTTEAQLQEGLAEALSLAGFVPEREHWLAPGDRVDILVGRVAIEVKCAGSLPAVTRQLRRYAASDNVGEIVLVTTRAAHRAVPVELDGKPVYVAWLSGRLG